MLFSHSRPRLLVAALAASELLYLGLLDFEATNGFRPVVRFLTALAALFFLYAVSHWSAGGAASRSTLFWIWSGGILFRLTLLPAGLPFQEDLASRISSLREDLRGERVVYERFLLYDSDIWRYVWDGHVASSGVSPYRYPPSEPALDFLTDDDELWSDVRDNVSHPHVPTVYPPLSQALFRLSHALAPGSVLAMKALVTVLDLGAAVLLALTLRTLGRSPTEVLLYLWNPLVVKVFAGSGHQDSLLVFLLAALAFLLSADRKRLAAVSYGLAVVAKIAPIVLLPLVWKRLGWMGTALALSVAVLGYALAAAGAGWGAFSGLLVFGRDWQFNAGPHALVSILFPGLAARAILGCALAGVLLLLARLDDGRVSSFVGLGATAMGLLIVLGPTAMPWYVTWVLPFAILSGTRVWLVFSGLVCLAFLVMIDGEERPAVLVFEYGALALVATYPRWRGLVPYGFARQARARSKASKE